MTIAKLAAASMAVICAVPVDAEDSAEDYPFERFVGTWKLKDDKFQQVWDGETVQTLSIPGHRTRCAPVNTSKTILCEVDAVDFEGHILWAINGNDNSVTHLSHFDDARLGSGNGTLEENGDLRLELAFTDEPQGTHRKYSYIWVSENEYRMHSAQYGADGRPTGNWYGGNFVRVEEDE